MCIRVLEKLSFVWRFDFTLEQIFTPACGASKLYFKVFIGDPTFLITLYQI
jgi:hypothetical protein